MVLSLHFEEVWVSLPLPVALPLPLLLAVVPPSEGLRVAVPPSEGLLVVVPPSEGLLAGEGSGPRDCSGCGKTKRATATARDEYCYQLPEAS